MVAWKRAQALQPFCVSRKTSRLCWWNTWPWSPLHANGRLIPWLFLTLLPAKLNKQDPNAPGSTLFGQLVVELHGSVFHDCCYVTNCPKLGGIQQPCYYAHGFCGSGVWKRYSGDGLSLFFDDCDMGWQDLQAMPGSVTGFREHPKPLALAWPAVDAASRSGPQWDWQLVHLHLFMWLPRLPSSPHGDCIPRVSRAKCVTFYDLALEVASCHFFCILWVNIAIKVCSDSRRADPLFDGRSVKEFADIKICMFDTFGDAGFLSLFLACGWHVTDSFDWMLQLESSRVVLLSPTWRECPGDIPCMPAALH